MRKFKKSIAEVPQLLMEWDNDKNPGLIPSQVASGSTRKVWWRCRCGNEWQSSPNMRTSNGTGCPACAKRNLYINRSRVTTNANLETRFPEIAKQWHLQKNESIYPKEFAAGSRQKVWWQCEKGHEWQSSIASRTSCGSGCPFCSGRRHTAYNNLAIMFPELAKEWHPKRNEGVYPQMVTPHTGRKVWWLCLKDITHEWEATVANRHYTSCPMCNSSKGEVAVEKCLQKQNIRYAAQWKIEECCNIRPLPFDFGILDDGKCVGVIEYHGEQHYRPIGFGGKALDVFEKIQKRDAIKAEFCKDNHLPLLVIPFTHGVDVSLPIIDFYNSIMTNLDPA